MPPIRPFHTSLYLSLALAVLSIGVAGGDLLPELPYLTGFSLLLLCTAYYSEGRWQFSLRTANMVGLGLGAVLGLWALFQVVRPPTGLMEALPWPASALPYLAPVLMILIPAKLLRPKHIGDYWAMHGLGILAMALACAMASDGVFVILFAIYAVVFVWSLSTFHLIRELGPVRSSEPLRSSRWSAIRPAILRAALAGVAAIPFFWATPRSGSEWELGINTRGRTTGVSEGPLDLNTTGPITVNQEKVFEVYAADSAGQPVLTIPPDQRFRAFARLNYDGGKWVRNQTTILTPDRAVSPPSLAREPRDRIADFGPGTIYFTYRYSARNSRTPPLADPIAWRPGQLSPAASKYPDGSYRSFVHRPDGTIDGMFDDIQLGEYIQAWVPPDQPGVGPVMRVYPMVMEHLTRLPRGLNNLRTYTDQLIGRLVSQGVLLTAVETEVDPDTRARLPRHHLAIAQALEQHLSSSGEFTYSLDLTRKDKSIDPTEDFLLNTRSGHCQRFATALVLMLRTQGIPSQMVIGYRGCEGRGDGWYDVREDHSHAWVEVLVPSLERRRPYGALWDQAVCGEGVGGIAVLTGVLGAHLLSLSDTLVPMHWVTLDPTPSSPEGEATRSDSLLSQARQRWEALLKTILLAYNEDSRGEAFEAVGVWLIDDNGGFYLAGCLAASIGLRFLLRRWRTRTALFAGYPSPVRRLALTLTRAGYSWPPGTTVREFAESVSRRLASEARTVSVAEVPVQIVAAYYAERFGGTPVSTGNASEQDRHLRRLKMALG